MEPQVDIRGGRHVKDVRARKRCSLGEVEEKRQQQSKSSDDQKKMNNDEENTLYLGVYNKKVRQLGP